MVDYSKAKIYKILNYMDDDVYIGATCQTLSERMAGHRRGKNGKDKKHYKLYQKINEIGVEHFYIELIEETPCNNAEQLRAEEGEYIRKCATLNSRIEGRTKKEYIEDTKERKAEYGKKRREEKRDELSQQKKEYYANDIENQRIKHQETYQKIRDKKKHVLYVIQFIFLGVVKSICKQSVIIKH